MKRLLYVSLIACVVLGIFNAEAQIKRTCNIVFIGNSITEGALHQEKDKTAPPVFAAHYVGRMLGADVTFRNCGRSGATTVDFLPERERDFKRVERAIADIQKQSYEPIVFSIMLGTNDSASKGPLGSPVSNKNYKKNLLTMIERLRELCPNAIFVLQRPVWYSPNTYNGARYLVAGLNRMTDYITVLVELANENSDVYLGDCESYDLFKHEYKKLMFAEDGNAGTFYLHPNEDGAVELSKNWAKAIISTIKASQR